MDTHHADDSFEVNKILTTEGLLASLRKGNAQNLALGLGEIKVPCRLINANEEAKIYVLAKQKSLKDNPTGLKQEVFDSHAVMKAILIAATTINGAPTLPMGFVDALTSQELVELYDQYITINKTINPNIQSMTPEEIIEVIQEVKKKGSSDVVNGLFTHHLAAIGRYFLVTIIPSLQTASAAGTQS
jgi:hypothetical protein